MVACVVLNHASTLDHHLRPRVSCTVIMWWLQQVHSYVHVRWRHTSHAQMKQQRGWQSLTCAQRWFPEPFLQWLQTCSSCPEPCSLSPSPKESSSFHQPMLLQHFRKGLRLHHAGVFIWLQISPDADSSQKDLHLDSRTVHIPWCWSQSTVAQALTPHHLWSLWTMSNSICWYLSCGKFT